MIEHGLYKKEECKVNNTTQAKRNDQWIDICKTNDTFLDDVIKLIVGNFSSREFRAINDQGEEVDYWFH